jgi:hypothetical protein
MAAFIRAFILVPGAASRRASALSTHRGIQRRTMHLYAMAARVAGGAGQAALFVWTVLALAFSLLVMAGFLLR